jgi:hypothetical protein
MLFQLEGRCACQVQTHADTAYYMGAIDRRQRGNAKRQERAVARLIRQRRWRQAHEKREALLQYIQVAVRHFARCSRAFTPACQW